MEITHIREEADILSRLIRLRNIEGITNEEWQKMLSVISDETILEIAKVGFYSQEAAEILQERMRKWPEAKLIETVKSSDRRLAELADDVLIKSMMKWSRTKLEKMIQNRNTRIVTAVLEADNRRKEIDRLREKLGLDPHH